MKVSSSHITAMYETTPIRCGAGAGTDRRLYKTIVACDEWSEPVLVEWKTKEKVVVDGTWDIGIVVVPQIETKQVSSSRRYKLQMHWICIRKSEQSV